MTERQQERSFVELVEALQQAETEQEKTEPVLDMTTDEIKAVFDGIQTALKPIMDWYESVIGFDEARRVHRYNYSTHKTALADGPETVTLED